MSKKQPNDQGGNGHSAFLMAFLIIVILVVGFILAYVFNNFAFVPFAVVVMGIVAFFGVLYFVKELSGSGQNRMRKAITVAIVVVYFGLLPTLAFQGILQFQVTGNTTTVETNQTLNGTVKNAVTVIPQNISLSETVVSSFTALVAAVLLFYFGSRSLDGYTEVLRIRESKGSDKTPPDEDNSQAETEAKPPAEDGAVTLLLIDDSLTNLEKLAELKGKGTIKDEEFQSKKIELLAQPINENILENLEKLAEIKDKKIISCEEFESKKKELLAQPIKDKDSENQQN